MLAIGQSPPSVPHLLACPWAAHKWQLTSLEQTQERARVGEQDDVHHLFGNRIFEGAQHHFCHVLFITSQSLSPTHIQGEEIPQGILRTRTQGPKRLNESFLPRAIILLMYINVFI